MSHSGDRLYAKGGIVLELQVCHSMNNMADILGTAKMCGEWTFGQSVARFDPECQM